MYSKQQPESIQTLFSSIAHQYDMGNSILSLNMHKRWNRQLVDTVIHNAKAGGYLDLCCGTGEIAMEFLKRQPATQRAFLLDFCSSMLDIAKEKSKRFGGKHHIDYLQADAQAIPLEPESVTCATMAYGIRNIKNPLLSLCDTYRVLKPQGVFGILELTRPKNPILRTGHKCYLNLLPLLGKLVTSNKQAYNYLCNSIQSFIDPTELALLMQDAGFKDVKVIPLLGGVATIFLAKK